MGQWKVWNTDGLPVDKALVVWNEAISSAFLDVRTERREHHPVFNARLQSLEAGELCVNRLQAPSYSVAGGGDSTHEWAFINLHHQGTCQLRQHGREQSIGPGDVSLNLGCSPFDFSFAAGLGITCLRLPLALLASRTQRLSDAVARPLPVGAPTQLFVGYAHHLAQSIDALQAWQVPQATHCLMDLLALAVDSHHAPDENTRSSVREALYQRARRFLIEHQGDAALSPLDLAAHLHMAPRTLQCLFQAHHTTFTKTLLELRLLTARQLMARAPQLQVAQVAYRVGFSDLSYFNRTFRRRFGMTPGEQRRSENVS